MDTEDLKEALAEACENGLDGLDECEITKKGVVLTFMTGAQFRLVVEDLSEDEDDDED
jgi:hypothetical protein